MDNLQVTAIIWFTSQRVGYPFLLYPIITEADVYIDTVYIYRHFSNFFFLN